MVPVKIQAVPGLMTQVNVIICFRCNKPYGIMRNGKRTVELCALRDKWNKVYGLWHCPGCEPPKAMPEKEN